MALTPLINHLHTKSFKPPINFLEMTRPVEDWLWRDTGLLPLIRTRD